MRNYSFLLLCATLSFRAFALPNVNFPPFTSGSSGANGALVIPPNVITNIPATTTGIYHYTTVSIGSGATVTFARNDANTPIHLLASGDVSIEGVIQLSGEVGSGLHGGLGGPGGFDGGKPGIAGAPPGAGYGPGAGKGGPNDDVLLGAGGGAHATAPVQGISGNKGSVYGSELLVPLVGGSGGGGMPGQGGGGGGGAIAIASSTRIVFNGAIRADGGLVGFGYGSGGAIRLVAPIVAGNGVLSVSGAGWGGDGRIRIDAFNRDQMNFQFVPGTPRTLAVGAFMAVFPPVNPSLSIVNVAGQEFPPGTRLPITVTLPVGAPASQFVQVEARNFNQLLNVTVALTPDSGEPMYHILTLDNRANNPVKSSVQVSLPPNTVIRVMAWTR